MEKQSFSLTPQEEVVVKRGTNQCVKRQKNVLVIPSTRNLFRGKSTTMDNLKEEIPAAPTTLELFQEHQVKLIEHLHILKT